MKGKTTRGLYIKIIDTKVGKMIEVEVGGEGNLYLYLMDKPFMKLSSFLVK